jgi:hypothetical protein
MRIPVIAAATVLLGTVSAYASPIPSPLIIPTIDNSLIERAGCGAPGEYCPYGYMRKCGPWGCTCKPCGYNKPYKNKRYYRPY